MCHPETGDKLLPMTTVTMLLMFSCLHLLNILTISHPVTCQVEEEGEGCTVRRVEYKADMELGFQVGDLSVY